MAIGGADSRTTMGQPTPETGIVTVLGSTLRALRRQANLTQIELANLSGLSLAVVGYIERGFRHPGQTTPWVDRDTLMALARGIATEPSSRVVDEEQAQQVYRELLGAQGQQPA